LLPPNVEGVPQGQVVSTGPGEAIASFGSGESASIVRFVRGSVAIEAVSAGHGGIGALAAGDGVELAATVDGTVYSRRSGTWSALGTSSAAVGQPISAVTLLGDGLAFAFGDGRETRIGEYSPTYGACAGAPLLALPPGRVHALVVIDGGARLLVMIQDEVGTGPPNNPIWGPATVAVLDRSPPPECLFGP
jgi:hypothetical protein